MKKRIAAITLAVLCILSCFTGCHDSKINDDDVKGAEISIYLGQQCKELDPALCLNNDSALQICSLLYDTLFKLDANGNLKKSLCKSYEIIEDEKNDEYKMLITMRDDTSWSDGVYVSAEDVVFAWKRILDAEFNSDAAALLFDIQNAKEAKGGDCSIDDVGIYAVDELVLQITFTGKIDYEAFLLNLTSVALAPLRELIVSNNGDWAKKPATTVCSGPFMIRRVNYGFDTENNVDASYASLILERNPNYRRTTDAKHVDTSVTPYRLYIDFSMTAEEVIANFENGADDDNHIFYVGDIPLSQRLALKDTATVSDLLSTHTYYFNENADVKKSDGTTVKLFADKNVRLALSSVIDRTAIAEAVVFAKAADAFVPAGIFETDSAKTLFRTVGGSLISTSADTSAAASYIAAAGITPSEYTFSIMVCGYDEEHCAIADAVCEAWKSLGFNVTVDKVEPEVNDEKLSGEDVKDIYDDIFCERFYANDYAVAAVDVIASAPTAVSYLAPFAAGYSGQGQDMKSDNLVSDTVSKVGYNSEAYNALIADALSKTDLTERAAILHDAEKLLLEDAVVMPVVYNQSATLTSSDLSGIKTDYYGAHNFTNVSQKNWIDYIETTLAEETTVAP